MENARKLIELCVLKMKTDNLYLLELLAMVFNPNSKYVINLAVFNLCNVLAFC